MKYEGKIGLFPNKDPHSDCGYRINLIAGDEGVPINDLLPEDIKLVYTKEDITDEVPQFFQIAYLWLCDMSKRDELYKKALKEQTTDERGGLQINPSINLEYLKLILPDGTVDKKRMIRLFQIVGKVWKYKPMMGMICEYIKRGVDLKNLEGIVKVAAREQINIFHKGGMEQIKKDPAVELLSFLAPPDIRDKTSDRIIKEEEVNYALKWVSLWNTSKVEGHMSLKQLGLIDHLGKINKDRAILVSDYIWGQHPADPDYATLLYWLQKNHPRDPEPHQLATKILKPKNPRKIKKKKRKAKKQSQKVNRKKK